MNKIRLFLNSVFFSILALSISLQAGISPLAFNGVFECFKPEYKMYATNLGCAALQTGLVNSLRFYMVNPGKKDAHGNRLWIEDKAPANNPVAALAILLFPSPAGSLTALTSHPDNIGRHLTVEHVAQLLNFCAHVRKTIQLMGGNRFGKNAVKCIGRLVAAANKKIKSHAENYFSKFFESETYSPDTASRNTLRSLLKHTQQGRELLTALCKVIEFEERCENIDAQFYPKFQAEQLLNAFFCLKFGQEDIPTLLANLDDSIVDHETLPEARLIDASDLETAAQKHINDFSMDDLWALQNRDLIDLIIPYARNSRPINNGLALAYHRPSGKLIQKEFPDCTETFIRHLSNLALFSKSLHAFDLTIVKKKLLNSFLLKNLEEFYAIQTPEKANSGENTVRNAFSKVVGDLGYSIRYRAKSSSNSTSNDTEVDSGIINILRVLNIMYNLEFDAEPVYQNGQQFANDTKKWAQNSLQKIFKLLNPEKEITIDITNVSTFLAFGDYEHDCQGNIHINVNNEFKCSMSIESNHAQFDSIDIIAPQQKIINSAFLMNINEHFKLAFRNNIWESLFLLNEKTHQFTQHQFYILFKKSANDNLGIIELLNHLLAATQENKISITHAAIILKNCLQMFSWQDETMARKIQTILKKWKNFVETYNIETLKKVLQNEVKVIYHELSRNDSSQTINNFLAFFNNLSTLILQGESPDKIEISSLSNLVNLNLQNANHLKSLKLSGDLERLNTIDLFGSNIEHLEISAHLPNLKTLNVINTAKLKQIIISSVLRNLTKLDLSNSGITRIELSGEKLPNIKSLNLYGTKELLTLKLINKFVHLSEMTLIDSNISTIVIQGSCPSIETLDFSFNTKLKLIKLSGLLEKLKKMSIINVNTDKIKISGTNCPIFENLTLTNTDCKSGIELHGNFENLKVVNFFNSRIKELKIFGNCPNIVTQDSRIKFANHCVEVGNKRNRDELAQNESPIPKKSCTKDISQNSNCNLL